MATPRQTVGRDEESRRLHTAIEGLAAGRGKVLVLEGVAGAGKTHLMRDALVLAADSGLARLEATGDPLTAGASFGLALELVNPLLARVEADPVLAPLLPGPAGAEAPERPPESVALASVALARLCIDEAGKSPLVLAVDDIQWGDAASLAALEAIARRISEAPVLMILGWRRGEAIANPEAISLLTGELLGERIEVGPLPPDGVTELLRLHGVDVAEDAAGASCAELTGGNALLVTRVAAALAERNERASVTSLSRLARENALDIAASVTSQLRRQGPVAGEVAAIAAVLGDHARWRYLRAIATYDGDQIEAAADQLVGAGILDAGDPVTFTHQLVRDAVYQSQAPGEAARRHLAAARILAEDEADSEQVASHLLLTRSRGEADTVMHLESAARQAMRRGVPGVAVDYLRRALAEPPAAGDSRARAQILLGRALAQLGQEGAEEAFGGARDQAQSASLRAEADLGLGRLFYSRGSYAEAERILERGRAALGAEALQEQGLAAELRAASLAAARYAGNLNAGFDERLQGLLATDSPGGSPAERSLLAELATELGVQGEPRATVISLAQRAWADGEMLLTADRHGIAISQVAAALVWSDSYREAEEMLTHAARHSAATGARTGQATARYMRGWVRLYTGQLAGAVADGRAALRADGWGMYVPAAAAMLAHCHIELAQLDEAARVLELPDGDEPWQTSIPFALTLEARARLAALRGAHEEALAMLGRCGELCLPMGTHQPFSSWRSRKARLLHLVGETEAAQALVEEELAPCRRAGAPRPLGIALTAAGAIRGGQRGIELISEACTVLAGSGALIEQARTLTELGMLMRREGQDVEARKPLREALSLADGAGATALAETAAAELTAAGGRPRRRALQGPDSLTPGERRAARLAAAGHTNREIAELLVVTPKTVQFHLSNAYRKLGITSRDELDTAL